jgi:hypothetical protein
MEKELTRIYQKGESNYKVNDRGAFQGIDDKVTHSTTAGDVDSGKAWKKLRRPSDINDYKKEMRELREASNTRKASGKVFVWSTRLRPRICPCRRALRRSTASWTMVCTWSRRLPCRCDRDV